MPSQTVTWTTLPNGRAGNQLRFSVHVAPRLRTDGPDGTLEEFPDWADWPANFAAGRIRFRLVFSGPGLTLPPIPVEPLPLYDSARWTGLFVPATLVKGFQFSGFANTKINSYPVSHVVDFLEEQYGKFGTRHPDAFPPYEELVADHAFGPIGYEDVANSTEVTDDTGPERRADVRDALDAAFDTVSPPPKGGPDTWALPFVPGAQSEMQTSMNFMQVEKYLRRDLPGVRPPLPDLEVPEFDFHELAVLTREYRTLVRLMGLVLDFQVAAPTVPVPADTRVRVEVTWTPQLVQSTKTDVTPYTHCTVGPDVFEARPRPGGDLLGRQLRVGDQDAFEVVMVDADGGAVKAMQFADNVTRSRISISNTSRRKRSLRTPDRFALPALATGGMGIARRGRANLLAHVNQHVVVLDGSMFLPSGEPAVDASDPLASHAELYLDDVTRGYRWDVLDAADGRWRSLMWRTGRYDFLDENLAKVDELSGVEEEACVVTAVGTSGAENDPGDLYLTEIMARWRGWSLGARQVGRILVDGALEEQDNKSQGVRFEAHLDVPPGSLPRLRFGRSYRFRARAVDLAANSLDASEGEIGGPDTVTPRFFFHRFEPVEAPRALLRHRSGKGDWTTHAGDPGAGAEWVVIRSEDRDHPSATTSERHVVPPRSTQRMAEWHGKFDLGTPGQPIDKSDVTWTDIKDREAAKLESLGMPEGPANPGSYFFDTPKVPIEYLPDPLAKRAFLRRLPPGPNAATEHYVAFEDPQAADQTWPKLRGFRVLLQGGPTATWGYDEADRLLTVTVPQGDIYTVPLSCAFDTRDTDLMALWLWLRDWANDNGITWAQLRTRIDQGRHWMFTPSRRLTLVHAVRTPLKDPVFVNLSPDKTLVGATAATFEHGVHDGDINAVDCSRKSTSKLEIVGSWQMPLDRGPNTHDTLPVVEGSADDPTVLRQFSAPAFTIPVDRSGGDPPGSDIVPIHARQEFGDTKFRNVTYDCKATSAFVEYFREAVEIGPVGTDPVGITEPYEPTTVKIKAIPDTGRSFTVADDRGPFDPNDPADQARLAAIVDANPPIADYVLDDTNHTIRRTTHGSGPTDAPVGFSFVRPQVHTAAQPVVRPVPNSARPAAPEVLYVLPAFAWHTEPASAAGPYTSIREGGYLRIYLQRPWHSSGDGEKLGVVLWRGQTFQGEDPLDPVAEQKPFVTMWGYDPISLSAGMPVRPLPESFPLATAVGLGLSLEELSEAAGRVPRPVDVAGHDVGFDFERGLWYCDIQVTQDERNAPRSYFPFVRLALARYQPTSINHCHLSRVVLADFIQLAPSRTASIAGTGSRRRVTMTGHSYVRNAASPGGAGAGAATSQVRVYTEEAQAGIPDEHLRWDRKPGHVVLSATQPNPAVPTLFVWTGEVPVPANPINPTRLVVEEVEVHFRATVPAGSESRGERVVHTDVLPLS